MVSFTNQHSKPTLPNQTGDDEGAVVLERQVQKVKPPQLYQVILFNDDFTPMEFVVFVIMEFFGKDEAVAIELMLKVHREGRAVCGIYTRDVAQTKVNAVMQAAHDAGHPLQALCEPIDN